MAVGHKTMDLLALGLKAVDFAIKRGVEEAEAFLSMYSSTSINIERGQIVRSIKNSDQGLGVRAVYRKAVGFSYTNTLTVNNVEDAAARAFKAAKASKPDKNWVNLPSPNSFGETKGTYDKKIVELSSDELVQIATDMS